MAGTGSLTKRVALDKANLQIVIIVTIAAFISVFCLVASKSLLSINSHQARVISAKDTANNQLKSNIQSYNSLVSSYKSFIAQSPNVINGPSTGSGPNVANNSQIVLRALPPSYDFPALITSINKILSEEGLSVSSISGTDEQLTEGTNNNSSSPQPVAMPFSFTVNNASYGQLVELLTTLQASIRPIQVDTLNVTAGGNDNTITISITAHTYYQPSKTLTITEQSVQ